MLTWKKGKKRNRESEAGRRKPEGGRSSLGANLTVLVSLQGRRGAAAAPAS